MKLSIIGSGDWGSILIEKFESLLTEGVHLVYGHQNIDYYHEEGIEFTEDIGKLMDESDAVVIASPPETHFDLAYAALQSDCHVWVEKPMCLNSPNAYKLVWLANEKKKLLFVDHQLCYATGIKNLLGWYEGDEIIEAAGIFKKKFSAEKNLNSAWNLGIHLVAIAIYLDIPLSKFTLHTTHTGSANMRAFRIRAGNGFTSRWDIKKNEEDLVALACCEFLKAIASGDYNVRTDGEHGLEVIRAMEWLIADWSQTVETEGEPMILPVFGRGGKSPLTNITDKLIMSEPDIFLEK